MARRSPRDRPRPSAPTSGSSQRSWARAARATTRDAARGRRPLRLRQARDPPVRLAGGGRGRDRGPHRPQRRGQVDPAQDRVRLSGAVRPRLLLLDEPSAALAPRFIADVYDTIRALNGGGIAMLIVEQNVEAILAVAHRVFVLDLGRNAFDGTPAELRASDRIRRLYLGEDEG